MMLVRKLALWSLGNARTRPPTGDKTDRMATEPRPSIVSSCIELLDRLVQLSEKVTRTLRGVTKTYKEAEAVLSHLRDVRKLATQLRRAVVAFFRPEGGTAEAC